MITSNLESEILIEPYKKGANELYIVSGYASAAMAFHLFEVLDSPDNPLKVELLIGMAGHEGMSISDHKGFLELSEKYGDRFKCLYFTGNKPVHAKMYSWHCDGMPLTGFVGSANFTQRGFSISQKEAMESSNAKDILEQYNILAEDSIECKNPDAENIIDLYVRVRPIKEVSQAFKTKDENIFGYVDDIKDLKHVQVSFLSHEDDKEIPQRSGLNWGQRLGREPNQAYIPLPSSVYNSDFFPPRGEHFTIITDDGQSLFCTRAQQNGKAIHTPENNSLLGIYFRKRLGVEMGSRVHLEDLKKYGRTNVDFYKIDIENFFMDFSVPI